MTSRICLLADLIGTVLHLKPNSSSVLVSWRLRGDAQQVRQLLLSYRKIGDAVGEAHKLDVAVNSNHTVITGLGRQLASAFRLSI